MATEVSVWLDVLAGSHDRLSDLVCDLDDDELCERSYCDEWTVAQVLSHIGSGAEILGKSVDAVVNGEDPPSRDTFPQIWARWNAMAPREVAEAALSRDGELVEKLENLGDALDGLEFTLFGRLQVDAVGLLWVRLSEHALHTWDIAVALDPRSLVDHDAVVLLSDRLPQAVRRLGKPERAEAALPFVVRVVTEDPDRQYDLEVDDAVSMTRVEGASPTALGSRDGHSKQALHLPAEALVRLVYGRLDASHSPLIDPDEQSALDTLRRVFPGI